MAGFTEIEPKATKPVLFETVISEVPGGVPLFKATGAYEDGVAIGYDATSKQYKKVVKGGTTPNFTFTPTPIGLVLDAENVDGGALGRCITMAQIKKENLPTSTDADILAVLTGIKTAK